METKTETETLLIKGVEERVGRASGKAFWVISTDKGEYTCHEPKVFDELAKNQGNICKLETLRTEKYNNIKGFIEVVEVGEKPTAAASDGGAKSFGAKIEMLVSYAKDLVVAKEGMDMDKAMEAVIAAYKKASAEL